MNRPPGSFPGASARVTSSWKFSASLFPHGGHPCRVGLRASGPKARLFSPPLLTDCFWHIGCWHKHLGTGDHGRSAHFREGKSWIETSKSRLLCRRLGGCFDFLMYRRSATRVPLVRIFTEATHS